MKNMRRRQLGISLLEIVLGIALLGTVLTLATQIDDRAQRETNGRIDADSSATFMNLAAQYFLDNRTAFEAAMVDGTGAANLCRINVNVDGSGGVQKNSTTLHTCAFDTTFLRAKKVWPSNAATDEMDGRFVVILRLVYDGGASTGGVEGFYALMQPNGALSAVGRDAQRFEQAVASMRALGGLGGFIPVGDAGPCKSERASATYQACGNGWKVNLAEFIDTTALTVFASALPN